MGLKDGYAICEFCGRKVPADSIPRGWIIISGGRIKESCVRIRLSYGKRESGVHSLLESFTQKVGVWCGIICFDHYCHTGRPRGFGPLAMLVEKHKRGPKGRPKLAMKYFYKEIRPGHWVRRYRSIQSHQ